MQPNKPGDTKRERISKAQQLTMVEVLIASLILGTCIVLATFLMKYIGFNARILTVKGEALNNYDQAIRDIGVCVDKDNNGRLTDDELNNCDPNAVNFQDVVGSLRYNVFEAMAQNSDLESVARKRNDSCYDEAGQRIDFNAAYNSAKDDTERKMALQAMKVCSALRVIPDALPALKNTEALMASLNQIFIVSGWEPESLAPRDDKIDVDIAGVEAIPVTLRVEGDGTTVLKVLDNIERSIREFNVRTATIEWNSAGISLQAQANAYYLDEMAPLEIDRVFRATETLKNNSTKKSVTDMKNEAMESVK